MNGLRFIKMHGLGNDFVVLDARAETVVIDAPCAQAIADRHTGVGCDQIITVEPPNSPDADAFMRIHNADGGEVEACGNGARCVAAMLMEERGSSRVMLETVAGLLPASSGPDGTVAVDMGEAKLDWQDIPLAEPADTRRFELSLGELTGPAAVNMGNPHAVFFVTDAESVPLAESGPVLEHHEMFPERANIGIAQILDATRLRLRVWERGVGITRACGSAACAAVVAAARRELTRRQARVTLDGGELDIAWRADGHVCMTGPIAVSFTGVLDPATLERERP